MIELCAGCGGAGWAIDDGEAVQCPSCHGDGLFVLRPAQREPNGRHHRSARAPSGVHGSVAAVIG